MRGCSRIEHEVALGPADAGETRTGLRLCVRLLEVAYLAGFHRHQQGAATARAAAGVDPHTLRLREFEEVARRRLPAHGPGAATEGHFHFREHRGFAR